MEKLGPIQPPTAAPIVGGVVMHGRGWAMVHAETGFMLRILSTGDEIPVKDQEVTALRSGAVTAETLLLRAGFSLGSSLPQANATTVAFSAEGQRLSGQKGVAEAGVGKVQTPGQPKGSGKRPGKGAAAVPMPLGLAIAVVVIVLALIWGVGR